MKRIRICVVAAVVTALWGCGKTEQKREALPAQVKTEVATRTMDYDQLVYVGQVVAESETSVSFSSMGSLLTVNVNEGQKVSKGQVLATIDPASVKSALDGAKAQLAQAHDAQERLRQVHDAGSLPEIKWVEIQSQVRQAESQVQMLEKQMADCRVVAPVNGVIGKGICHVGETALPGEPLMRILNIDHVRVSVSVPEKEYAAVSRATSASLTVEALGGERFESSSLTRGVEGDALTHTYTMWATVANPGHRLLPGMVANVRFGQQQAAPAITLPVRCVQRGAEGNFVWVVKDGRAAICPVVVGRTCGNRIVIDGGLTEGTTVITEGYQRLSEGQKVNVK